jgi:intracellular septation protein
MQLLIEFLPIALFFAAYKFADLYVATGVLIVAVIIQTAVQWIRQRKLNIMMIASAVLVLIFGGLTLWLHDATFIKWKPTILYLLFAAGFVFSQFIGKQCMVERLMGENFKLETKMWHRLNMVWAAFFVVLAALNLAVAYNFSESTWVNFKLFGLMGLMVVFVFAQAIWLSPNIPNESPSTKSEENKP